MTSPAVACDSTHRLLSDRNATIVYAANATTPPQSSSSPIRPDVSTIGCPALNYYGSREMGAVACECEERRGLHITLHSHRVEVSR